MQGGPLRSLYTELYSSNPFKWPKIIGFHRGEISPSINGVFQGPPCRDVMLSYMSQGKNKGYLLHIGDCTTPFLLGIMINHYKGSLRNGRPVSYTAGQKIMESSKGFFLVAQ